MLDRLQKIIAHAGIASRRHAEQLILSGQVKVNGVVVTELGTKADPAVDKIEAAGRLIEVGEDHVYLLLHKPPAIVSHLTDPQGRRTLRNFLRGFPKRVYPVGALDYDDSGLIFLTNDGDLTSAILKVWDKLPQSYHIKIKGRLTLEELDRLGKETGVLLRTVRQPDSTRGHATNFWYEAQTTGAKLDVLRRTLLKEMHPVEKVKRIGLGHLSLEGIPGGRYRLLNKKEAVMLRTPGPLPKFFPMAPESDEPKRKFAPQHKTFQRPAAEPGNNRRPFPPFKKPKTRPDHYTKLQRRPSSPRRREEEDAFDSQENAFHGSRDESGNVPWRSNVPEKPFQKFRGPGHREQGSRPSQTRRDSEVSGRPFRGSGKPPKFRGNSGRHGKPFRDSASRPPRHQSALGNSGRDSNRPGKPGRPFSGRPKGPRHSTPRRPKPPR